MVHRHQPERALELTAVCDTALREAQTALAHFPMVARAGFLFDAEKEYVEAVLTAALVGAEPLASYQTLRVGLAAWLNGLAEAASELRSHLLDLLREERLADAEILLVKMDEVYDLLVGVGARSAILAVPLGV